MHNSHNRKKSIVEMAVAALEVNQPLDMPMARFDPSPTALDLDDGGESKTCSNPRCFDNGVEACIVCGQLPREDDA